MSATLEHNETKEELEADPNEEENPATLKLVKAKIEETKCSYQLNEHEPVLTSE